MNYQKNKGWEDVADWYNTLTGQSGHYYQKEIILPKVLAFLKSQKIRKVLDLGSGQGVLEKALPPEITYCGVDISPSLVKQALTCKKSSNHSFHVADVTDKNFSLPDKDYEAATILLSLQDMHDPKAVFRNTNHHLKKDSFMILVINHPAFRIPRQSSWHVDEANKMQSRNIRSYMSSSKIPISIHPGKGGSSAQVTYHHHSLTSYSRWLKEEGFIIQELEEWVSEKQSTGPKAKMENRARAEFPLFLCLICKKIR